MKSIMYINIDYKANYFNICRTRRRSHFKRHKV